MYCALELVSLAKNVTQDLNPPNQVGARLGAKKNNRSVDRFSNCACSGCTKFK